MFVTNLESLSETPTKFGDMVRNDVLGDGLPMPPQNRYASSPTFTRRSDAIASCDGNSPTSPTREG